MNNLKCFRERAGLTIKELSKKTAISESVLCRAEAGVADMPGARWAVVAKKLGCSIDDLLAVNGR